MPAVPQHFPVKLTQAQRKVVAEIAPALADKSAVVQAEVSAGLGEAAF
jgi:hypothetical protein